MVYNIDTTTFLIERLKTDKNLRRVCGWERLTQLPSEATFSRAFAEFAEAGLPQHVHDALIQKTLGDVVALHKSTDSTAIDAREKPQSKTEQIAPKKRSRPKRGQKRPKEEPTRLEQQLTMTLAEMLADLPIGCDRGAKRDSKGNVMYWTGYKLHVDTIDGDIPVSAIVTSASVHDSQVAIPLATLSARRIINCYDLMDSAYDAPDIFKFSDSLKHKPIIDQNPRGNKALSDTLEAEQLARKTLDWNPAEQIRYNARSAAERQQHLLRNKLGDAS